MSTYLTRLALTEADVQRERVSALAIPGLTVRGQSPGTEQERDRVHLMVHHCRYHDTILLQHFDARVGKFAPPQGYAAIMHEDTTFRVDMLDRHIFRNVAITDLKRTKHFTDEEMRRNLARWNQCIRDQSPQPFTAGAGPWVPSLGAFAWLGVYRRRGASGAEYSLIVVAGMDDATYAHLYRQAASEWDGRLSVREALERLIPYREYALKNARRLLARALDLIQEESMDPPAAPEVGAGCPPLLPTPPPPKLCLWLPPAPVRIPLGYVVPRATPRDVSPIPPGCAEMFLGDLGERVHPELLAQTQVLVDDFKPYIPYQVAEGVPGAAKTLAEKERLRKLETQNKRHQDTKQVVRHASCGDTSHSAQVFLGGPLQPILSHPGPGPSPSTFDAYAAQVAQGEDQDGTLDQVCVPHTWEDAALAHNRLAQATFATQDYADPQAIRYQPLFIRISCKDSLGLVKNMPDKKRMNGFCSQNWIGL